MAQKQIAERMARIEVQGVVLSVNSLPTDAVATSVWILSIAGSRMESITNNLIRKWPGLPCSLLPSSLVTTCCSFHWSLSSLASARAEETRDQLVKGTEDRAISKLGKVQRGGKAGRHSGPNHQGCRGRRWWLRRSYRHKKSTFTSRLCPKVSKGCGQGGRTQQAEFQLHGRTLVDSSGSVRPSLAPRPSPAGRGVVRKCP